jgi:hypothetical protein
MTVWYSEPCRSRLQQTAVTVMPTSISKSAARTTGLPNAAGRGQPQLQPLTHHEIMGLIEPFARRGLRVDLDRSDRLSRCLAFKTIGHAAAGHPALAGLCEDLRLENPAPGSFRLTRTLTLPAGLAATLRIDGPRPGALLAAMYSVPVSQHFRLASGAVIACSYSLAAAADPGAAAGTDETVPVQPVLTQADARLEGLALHLKDADISSYPADIELVPEDGSVFEFPEDLFAVLGRGWGLIHRNRAGWKGTVDARGTAWERSRQLETMFERMVGHLAATLAEPPARFHETRRRARWGVALKRAAPLLVYVALLMAVAGFSRVRIANGSALRPLMWFGLTMLMVFALTMRNRPRLEVPRLPRRLTSPAWRQPPPTRFP